MKISYLVGQNIPLEIREVEKPEIRKGAVLVKLHYAALNHRDLWIKKGQYRGKSDGLVLGSDGAGVIEVVADDVKDLKAGDEVVINPSLDWGDNPVAQQAEFRILGNPDPGTFAEYILIDARQVYPKPKHLSLKEASALPLAALTAYRALFTRGKVEAEHDVLITGIGGGVAQFLLQFAHAIGSNIYVTSGKNEKIESAKANGAVEGFIYKEKDWVQRVKNYVPEGFDLIIDSAVGEGFSDLVEVTKPGGTLVFFGGTAGAFPPIVPAKIFWRQLNILGTTMGHAEEFKAMLSFYEEHKLKPVIDKVFPFDKINEAFERMDEGLQVGKIILEIGNQ